MQALQDIRKAFLLATDRSVALAQSLLVLLKAGEISLRDHNQRHPDATFTLGGGPPTASSTSVDIRISDVLDNYQRRSSSTEELVHTQMVQQWYDFLEDIYSYLLRDHVIHGIPHPKLGIVTTKLDLRKPGDWIERAVAGAVREFSFTDAASKFRTVARALEVEVPQELFAAVKKHVQVRNILQHNDGVLRRSDLRSLGAVGSFITLQGNSNGPVQFNLGERVVVTFSELVTLREDFHSAAWQLVS